MIKVNKKTEYALMALKYMADKENQENDELTTARELCDHFGSPFDTMSKVLQVMNTKGILNSTKGINGGYQLNTPLNEISFKDLTKTIEGKNFEESFCVNSKGLCELHETCNVAGPLERLNQKIQNYLTTITLQDLLVSEKFYNLSEKA